MAIPGAIVEEDVPVYLLNRKIKQAEPAQSQACSPGPDGAIGRTVEEVPYGIKMVQAVDPAMIQVSKSFKSKVLFCVIDTGLDNTNFEFSENTFGCMPKSLRADGTITSCKFPWSKDWSSHGTHTSGSIAALRNNRGIVGVSAEGSQLFHYNAFGPMGTFSMSDVIVAVTEEAVKTLAQERFNDMLLIAAAGNGAQEGAVYSYPAAWPEVVSVAAVDWSGKRAAFSQVNDRNDWAAPGVQTLSTVPVASAASSSYNAMPSVGLVNGPSSLDDSLLKTPAPRLLGQSKTARITGQLMDADWARQHAKICLMQRGDNTFCSKVVNCVNGGGIAAIIYGRDDMDDCETFDGSMQGGCTKPSAGWPVGITVTKAQGQALKEKISQAPSMSISIDARKSSSPLPLDFMSGTSMATPTAAGVAGLVWSAHTECSGPELRAAMSWTATDLGTPGYDNEFGHGLVQAAAAHKYLQANPCTGTRSPAEPSKDPARQPPAAPVRTMQLLSNVTNRVHVGSVVRFTAKVTSLDTARAEVKDLSVRLRPKPTYSMACGTTNVVKTDAAGQAVVHCTIVSPGTLALEGRIGRGQGMVKADSTVVAYGRARSPPSPSA
ncbi:peptidase S8/S53 domain-containing protein [Scenedesmus sp. NREL 46B-D3]|nr:peptidase S8/S53 domain-containing protein [Scenedesmus sp. NREL 46B-D3]